MSSINVFCPAVLRNKFTGGMLTVFEHARGLAKLGNEVRLIPIGRSRNPSWYDLDSVELRIVRTGLPLMGFLKAATLRDKNGIRERVGDFLAGFARFEPYLYRRASHIDWARRAMINADISIATSYETAVVNYFLGSGRKYYFAQHFEPIFGLGKADSQLISKDALLSYRLPDLKVIANSSWLSKKLRDELGIDAPVCLNAIDHRTFFPDDESPPPADRFVVLTYGGRDASWKGFEEAAEAVRLARRDVPTLEWRVFGDSLLPPNNSIATYTPLGFVAGAALRRAYSSAHVLLSPAWYESFPLYPLEAMACGTAVVTTRHGTEDYAVHERNALVLDPRDPVAMANALVSLFRDTDLRQRLALQASKDACTFTWSRATARMAQVLELDDRSEAAT